jgi:hypothetical protein
MNELLKLLIERYEDVFAVKTVLKRAKLAPAHFRLGGTGLEAWVDVLWRASAAQRQEIVDIVSKDYPSEPWQARHQAFNDTTGGHGSLFSPLLPYRCDRGPQLKQLRGALSRAAGRPLVCFVPAVEEQSAEDFINWVEQEHLIKHLGLDGGTKVRRWDLPWPGSAQTFEEEALADLADHLGVLEGPPTLRAVARKAWGDQGAPLLIATELRAQQWRWQWRELIVAFLAFWAGWEKEMLGKHLVACLIVKYEPASQAGWFNLDRWFRWSRWNSGMRKFLSSLPNSDCPEEVQVLVLDELADIEAKHASAWCNRLPGPFRSPVLRQRVMELFRPSTRRLPITSWATEAYEVVRKYEIEHLR